MRLHVLHFANGSRPWSARSINCGTLHSDTIQCSITTNHYFDKFPFFTSCILTLLFVPTLLSDYILKIIMASHREVTLKIGHRIFTLRGFQKRGLIFLYTLVWEASLVLQGGLTAFSPMIIL